MLGIMFMVVLLNRFVPLHRFPRVPKTSVPHDIVKVSNALFGMYDVPNHDMTNGP
jgi:hypothetical protein